MLLNKLAARYIHMIGKRTFQNLERSTRDPLTYNTDFLLARLRENADTEIGKKYHFADIGSIEQFKASVPLTIFDDYSEAIDRMKKGGERLLTQKNPECYAQTSGSVGNPKLIPVSGKAVSVIMENLFMIHYLAEALHKKASVGHERSLLIVSYVDFKELPSGAKAGDIAAMVAHKAKSVWNAMYTTPTDSCFANELHDFFYVHARFALTQRNIPNIGASYMTDVFEVINYIVTHQELLFDDIEKGSIHKDIKIGPEIREKLQKRIKPDPARAKELRDIFKTDDYTGILKKIWPKLLYINAIGSAAFAPYTERVKVYAGDDVAFFHGFYAASEGQMGMVTEFDSTSYNLLPHLMFYEFIPVEEMDKANPETLTLNQLELGKEYEIVLTNMSGFYRYRINDVVKVVGFWNKTPQVCFSYRKNQLINMAAEKTTYAQLESAVRECAKHFGRHITEFAVYPDLRDGKGHYTLLLETDDQTLKHEADQVAGVMHQKLCEANPDIQFAQEEGLLGATEVVFSQPQTFALYKDLMVMRGASRNQVKPVRLIDTPEKEKFFFGLLDKEE
jgi:hypothetical protein